MEVKKIKIAPKSTKVADRRIEEIRLMNIVPYLGTTNVFNSAQFTIAPTQDPCPGYEITPHTGPGGTIFVPATAVLAMKYTN